MFLFTALFTFSVRDWVRAASGMSTCNVRGSNSLVFSTTTLRHNIHFFHLKKNNNYGILTLFCKLLTILSLSADNSTLLGSSGTAHKFTSQSPTKCKPNTDFWFMMFSTASVTQSASASGEAGPPPVFFRVFFVLAATFLAFVFKFLVAQYSYNDYFWR